jgi:hypothetical protein
MVPVDTNCEGGDEEMGDGRDKRWEMGDGRD